MVLMNGQFSGNQTSDNCLNLIRLLAALQVMFGHLVEHLELPVEETVFRASYFFRGVPIFFVISGFLIWFSISKSKTYKNYLMKRFWRIYPELWITVILEIVVIIVLYHGWNIKQILVFAITQGTVFQFWTPDSLRAYGVGTPNGTLWTIGVMIQFYVIAWLFYYFMKKRQITTWLCGFVMFFIISYGIGYITHDLIRIDIVGKLYDQTFVRHFWLFYIGMFIAAFKEKILPMLIRSWHILLIIAAVFFWSGWDFFSGYYMFWSLFLTAGLIGFAYRFPKLSVNLDISYGIFLYQMIVMNVFVNYGLIGKWIYAFGVTIITIMCAYISTVTIGIWSTKHKRN